MTDHKLADAIAARDAAIQQAQIWKMEAQTANATIAEIYRLVGSKAGNWNGAKPVREALAAQDVRDAKPPANGEAELPPLPDRFDSVSVDDFTGQRLSVYTASQMEAYARAAIAALQQPGTPALPEVTDDDVDSFADALCAEIPVYTSKDDCHPNDIGRGRYPPPSDESIRDGLIAYRARLMAKAAQS